MNFGTLYLRSAPFASSCVTNQTFPKMWFVVTLNLIALLLGSWWALQEGTWGGWWNWDSSETFGLEVSLLTLLLIHSSPKSSFSSNLRIRHLLLTCAFVGSYFFIQLNFELVSHNFGSKFFFFFNNNLFSLEAIAVATLGLSILLKLALNSFLFLKTFTRSSEPTGKNLISYLKYPLKTSLWGVIACWLFWSYRPLLNYFAWNFTNLNLFNSENSLQPINLFLLLLLTIWLYQLPKESHLLTLLPSMLTANWIWILALLFRLDSFSSFIHYTLALFTVLNLSISDVSASTWFTLNDYVPLTFLSSPLFSVEESFTLDNITIEMSKNDANTVHRLSQNWNVLTSSNIPSINFFFLNFTHTSTKNHYNLGTSYSTIFLELELPVVTLLSSIFLLTLFFTRQPVNQTALIRN